MDFILTSLSEILYRETLWITLQIRTHFYRFNLSYLIRLNIYIEEHNLKEFVISKKVLYNNVTTKYELN